MAVFQLPLDREEGRVELVVDRDTTVILQWIELSLVLIIDLLKTRLTALWRNLNGDKLRAGSLDLE